jgi:probable rRNA maturation factor
MLRHLDLVDVELSIALVNDASMRELNKSYRGKNRPTDVLAFAMHEDDGSPLDAAVTRSMLGDIVISIDTARRQATAQKRSLLDEMTMLLAHGLLHLLGYDHDTKRKEKVMFAKARELELAASRRQLK